LPGIGYGDLFGPGKEAAMSFPVLDLRGLKCPLPVLRTRKKLRAMQPASRIWVETTDPLSVIDIPHYCKEDGHALLEFQERDGVRRFLIERGSQPFE
jgi:tRNA 2-thiouridine synthesizing protein A